LDQDAIGCAIQPFEVICDLRPIGDGAIVTRCETEN